MEKAHTNQFAICKCGHEVELIGQHDIELLICPKCRRCGCWTIDEWHCLECDSFGSYSEIRKGFDLGVDLCPNCRTPVVSNE